MLKLDFLSNKYEDHRSPAEKAEEKISIDILSGALKPGKQIVEQDLCKRFNMSRTPIREVLVRLEAKGLVEIIPNRGAFVVGITPQDIDDMFYMKTLLYPQCVRWAIERITPNEMEMLEETFSFMEFYTATEDYEKMLTINKGFESIIYHACHNREMEDILTKYDFIILHYNAGLNYPINYLHVVLEEHRAIMDGFRKHNPELGADAAQVHVFRSLLRRK